MAKKIIFLGYMGAGKSTIGKYIADMLGIPFFDLDEFIELKEQKSIMNIFDSKGEIYFRKIEHQYLNELINKDEEMVISLGGGTPCYANNHLHFEKDDIKSYYLKASIKTLSERLEKDLNERPLLRNTEDDLETFIAKHLFDRSYFYNKAKNKINIDDKTIQEIALEIKNTLI